MTLKTTNDFARLQSQKVAAASRQEELFPNVAQKFQGSSLTARCSPLVACCQQALLAEEVVG